MISRITPRAWKILPKENIMQRTLNPEQSSPEALQVLETLRRRVVDQTEATRILVDIVENFQAGFAPLGRPAGNALFSARRAMIAATSLSPSRASVRLVTRDFPIHGALNSGRKVTISSTGRVLIRSTVRPIASRLVGSIQCTSSKIISTGLDRDSVST